MHRIRGLPKPSQDVPSLSSWAQPQTVESPQRPLSHQSDWALHVGSAWAVTRPHRWSVVVPVWPPHWQVHVDIFLHVRKDAGQSGQQFPTGDQLRGKEEDAHKPYAPRHPRVGAASTHALGVTNTKWKIVSLRGVVPWGWGWSLKIRLRRGGFLAPLWSVCGAQGLSHGQGGPHPLPAALLLLPSPHATHPNTPGQEHGTVGRSKPCTVPRRSAGASSSLWLAHVILNCSRAYFTPREPATASPSTPTASPVPADSVSLVQHYTLAKLRSPNKAALTASSSCSGFNVQLFGAASV